MNSNKILILNSKYLDNSGIKWEITKSKYIHKYLIYNKPQCLCGRQFTFGFFREPRKIITLIQNKKFNELTTMWKCFYCVNMVEDDGSISMFDVYGKIIQVNGNEKPYQCFWCAKPIKRAGKRFCNDDCHKQYIRQYVWHFARLHRLEIDNYTCQECESIEALEVHHIIPVNNYDKNILHAQENLITLCRTCHNKKRRK